MYRIENKTCPHVCINWLEVFTALKRFFVVGTVLDNLEAIAADELGVVAVVGDRAQRVRVRWCVAHFDDAVAPAAEVGDVP